MYCILFFYCILLYCIVTYCIALNCNVLYCIVLYRIIMYCIVMYCIKLYVLYSIVLYCFVLYYWPAQPGEPRDYSGLCNCFLCSLYVCSLWVIFLPSPVLGLVWVCMFSVTFFLILLHYNIWLPHPHCNVRDSKLALRVDLRRHDTLT